MTETDLMMKRRSIIDNRKPLPPKLTEEDMVRVLREFLGYVEGFAAACQNNKLETKCRSIREMVNVYYGKSKVGTKEYDESE